MNNPQNSFSTASGNRKARALFDMLKRFVGFVPAIPIHYDCDPGQDDAIALMYALGSNKVDIQSISVVGGNVDVQKCARNVQQILDLTGYSEIPVHVGAPQPLKRLSQPLPDVFGESGMAGAEDLPDPSRGPDSQDAVAFLTSQPKMVMLPMHSAMLPFATSSLPSTWVATGPLTNIALALQKDPNLKNRIGHLIIMGGCTHPEHIHGEMGNFQAPGTDGWAEYNFAVDPEAAKIVLQSGIRNITLIGVNITRTVLFNHEVEKALRANGNTSSIVAANILSTVGPEDHIDYASCKDFPEDPVRGMHDVVAMAYLVDPDLFKLERFPITVVTTPSFAGQTLIGKPDHPAVNVVMDLNRPEFLKRMVQNLRNLP